MQTKIKHHCSLYGLNFEICVDKQIIWEHVECPRCREREEPDEVIVGFEEVKVLPLYKMIKTLNDYQNYLVDDCGYDKAREVKELLKEVEDASNNK